jgi:agmatine deiminase
MAVEPSAPTPHLVPRELGYRMPAEWEPHAATWLTWPRQGGISFPGRIDPIPEYWTRVAGILSQHEEVHINVFDPAQEDEVRGLLARSREIARERVSLHRFPAYEPWCRDHGPVFLTRQKGGCRELAVVDWGYNAWGGKYPPYDLDDAVPRHVASLLGVPLFEPGIVLEGGSIDVNGQGTLLTTESCLLNPNRNPHLSRGEIEQRLRDYLGVTNILWLGLGIIGDDTDGHIDDLARFVDPATVVSVVEADPADENHAPLQENLHRLHSMTDQDGRPLEIVTLPMPRPVFDGNVRLPACYANFYIANEVVLVPTFGDPADREAVQILQRLFPTRQAIPIPSRDVIWGLGALHCITQQQPAI